MSTHATSERIPLNLNARIVRGDGNPLNRPNDTVRIYIDDVAIGVFYFAHSGMSDGVLVSWAIQGLARTLNKAVET